MNQEKTNYVKPGTIHIIVKQLTPEIIKEAIEAYAEDNGYWIRLHQFADSIDISVFTKLEEEDLKRWKECDEWED